MLVGACDVTDQVFYQNQDGSYCGLNATVTTQINKKCLSQYCIGIKTTRPLSLPKMFPND